MLLSHSDVVIPLFLHMGDGLNKQFVTNRIKSSLIHNIINLKIDSCDYKHNFAHQE